MIINKLITVNYNFLNKIKLKYNLPITSAFILTFSFQVLHKKVRYIFFEIMNFKIWCTDTT